jgi:hypothetical protein
VAVGRLQSRAVAIGPNIVISDTTTQKVLDIIWGIGILHIEAATRYLKERCGEDTISIAGGRVTTMSARMR